MSVDLKDICCKKHGYHHGNLRETLINSALALLEEGSVQELSMRALARKAGVSQTAPYRHFEDKDELIAVLKTEGFQRLTEKMEQVKSVEKDPFQRLNSLGVLYIEFARENPAYFKLMFEHLLSEPEKYPQMQEAMEISRQGLCDVVGECLALPEARDIDPLVAEIGLWSMVHGFATLLLSGPLSEKLECEAIRDDMAQQITTMFGQALLK